MKFGPRTDNDRADGLMRESEIYGLPGNGICVGAMNPRMGQTWTAWLGFVAVLAAAQYLAVRLGLSMGIAHGNVSPVWPATGLAVAALLRFGMNLWPGVLIGSFFGLLHTGVGAAVVTGEAAAALLEAVTAVCLVRWWLQTEDSSSRARDVVWLCVLVGGVATAVSATIGVISLCVGRVATWESFAYLWGTWWLGDMMGALIVAPFLLIWMAPGAWRPARGTWSQTGLLFAGLIVTGVIAFWGPFVSSTGASDYPIAFVTLPMVVAATFLAGRRGATAACLICSAMAISGTAKGLGPFFRGSVNESLLLLQSYLVVISVTAIILAAVLDERDRAVEGLRLSYGHLDQRIAERTQELSAANVQLEQEVAERRQAEEDRERLITQLQKALAEVKKLSGMLPICSSCKKIRDDKGYWQQIDAYISDHSGAEFTHSLCPECAKNLYPEFYGEHKK